MRVFELQHLLPRRIDAAILGVALLGWACAPAPDRRLEHDIDAVFAELTARPSPGCSVAVVRAGEVVLAKGYGLANLEYAEPLAADSLFRIASTSKQFTAAVVLILVQEGALDLDSDIREYLPELSDLGTPVTLRHLIHHTSGYRDYLTLQDLRGADDRDWYTDRDVMELLARQRQLNFAPGTDHLYSNSGYFLLSQVVKLVTGKTLREVAAERIFGPLGMTSSHFHDDANEVDLRLAYGYAPDGDTFRRSETQLDMIGDGGVYTTVLDLAKWDTNFYQPEVGGQQLIDALLERGVLNNGTVLGYAAGLSHGEHRGLAYVAHSGGFVGYRAQLIRFPSEQTSVVCLCNVASADPTRFTLAVADIVLADRLTPVPDSTADDASPQAEAQAAAASGIAPASVAEYAGRYRSPELEVDYTLTADAEGQLRLAFGRREAEALAWQSTDRFATDDLTLRFDRRNGVIAGFELDAGRVRNLRFERERSSTR